MFTEKPTLLRAALGGVLLEAGLPGTLAQKPLPHIFKGKVLEDKA